MLLVCLFAMVCISVWSLGYGWADALSPSFPLFLPCTPELCQICAKTVWALLLPFVVGTSGRNAGKGLLATGGFPPRTRLPGDVTSFLLGNLVTPSSTSPPTAATPHFPPTIAVQLLAALRGDHRTSFRTFWRLAQPSTTQQGTQLGVLSGHWCLVWPSVAP